MKKLLIIFFCLYFAMLPAYSEYIEDELANKLDKNLKIEQYSYKPIYENENTTEVKVKIKKNYSTKQKIKEGEYLDFITVKDFSYKDKLYPAGTLVKARVETISLNKIYGVPSDVIVGNFSIDDIPLRGEISKTGANRALWLYPTIEITSWLCVGLLLIPIRGGHAKIKTKEIFTLEAL